MSSNLRELEHDTLQDAGAGVLPPPAKPKPPKRQASDDAVDFRDMYGEQSEAGGQKTREAREDMRERRPGGEEDRPWLHPDNEAVWQKIES